MNNIQLTVYSVFSILLHTDGSDYTGVVPRLLTFDMNNSEFPITINIIDDNIHELDENFFGRLSTDDEDAVLEPGQTRVRIQNDDGKVITALL